MEERRAEPRLLCADLATVVWDRRRRAVANLEDISRSGACIQVDVPIPPETFVTIVHPRASYDGFVRYCVFRETGYFVGVEFLPGCTWSPLDFRPKHLFDPRRMTGT